VIGEASSYCYKHMHQKAFLSEFWYLRNISIRKLEPFEDVENGIKVIYISEFYQHMASVGRKGVHFSSLWLCSHQKKPLQNSSYLFKFLGNATEIKDYNKDVIEREDIK
jgi:hypothetical protein